MNTYLTNASASSHAYRQLAVTKQQPDYEGRKGCDRTERSEKCERVHLCICAVVCALDLNHAKEDRGLVVRGSGSGEGARAREGGALGQEGNRDVA